MMKALDKLGKFVSLPKGSFDVARYWSDHTINLEKSPGSILGKALLSFKKGTRDDSDFGCIAITRKYQINRKRILNFINDGGR